MTAIGPRGRKEYRATPAGRAQLLRWIATPQDDPPVRSAGILRIFLLGELPPEQARAHLLTLADHAEAEVRRLKELEAAIDWSDIDPYPHAALEYGLRFNAMQANWARDVAAR